MKTFAAGLSQILVAVTVQTTCVPGTTFAAGTSRVACWPCSSNVLDLGLGDGLQLDAALVSAVGGHSGGRGKGQRGDREP